MWRRRAPPDGGFWTPPPKRNTKKRVHETMPMSEIKKTTSSKVKQESFPKVSSGDSPYFRAKHAQLISKDPHRAISLFWTAINSGDRVDSALKDMANVMQQLDRSDEGIEAIKSFRYLCPFESQDSIDNLLLDLFRKSGRIQEEAELLEHKLKALEQGTTIGARTGIAKRSHGKQIKLTIEQEKARILGNLAWVQLQLHNYGIAEGYYRNALSLEPDNNKLCNLAICLIHMDRIPEAKSLLSDLGQSVGNQLNDKPFQKSLERALEMLVERGEAVVTENSEGFTRSSYSDNFTSSCSLASWMKDTKSGNIYKKNSRVSSATVEQNSPVLITQPRECKWDDEKVDQRKTKVTIGTARKLRYGNSKSVESAFSTTNERLIDGKKLDDNSIHQCMISKARKTFSHLVREKEDAQGDQKRDCVSESSPAYAQVMDVGQRTV